MEHVLTGRGKGERYAENKVHGDQRLPRRGQDDEHAGFRAQHQREIRQGGHPRERPGRGQHRGRGLHRRERRAHHLHRRQLHLLPAREPHRQAAPAYRRRGHGHLLRHPRLRHRRARPCLSADEGEGGRRVRADALYVHRRPRAAEDADGQRQRHQPARGDALPARRADGGGRRDRPQQDRHHRRGP